MSKKLTKSYPHSISTRDRIKIFLNFTGISGRSLSEKIDASNNYFNVSKNISSKYLEQISAAFPELNMDWVITGRGEMFFEIDKEHIYHENAALTALAETKEKLQHDIYENTKLSMSTSKKLVNEIFENMHIIARDAILKKLNPDKETTLEKIISNVLDYEENKKKAI